MQLIFLSASVLQTTATPFAFSEPASLVARHLAVAAVAPFFGFDACFSVDLLRSTAAVPEL